MRLQLQEKLDVDLADRKKEVCMRTELSRDFQFCVWTSFSLDIVFYVFLRLIS